MRTRLRSSARIKRLALFALATLTMATSPFTAAAHAQWTLVEELRFGNGESEAYTFSDIRGIGVGTGGRIFVLDYKVQEIRTFDATGKFIKLAARRGRGPGEISDANGLVHGPNGSLWVNDPSNARFSVFGGDGAFLRQHTVPIRGYGFIWEGTVDPKGRVIDPLYGPGIAGSTLRAREVKPDGTDGDTLTTVCGGKAAAPAIWAAENKTGGRMMMSVPFTSRPHVRYDGRGGVWCTQGDDYRIVRVRLGSSDTLAIIERKVAPTPVSSQERAEAIARADSAIKRFGSSNADFSQIPRTKPFIEALHVDETGRVWVRRPTTDRVSTVIDVFDERGRFLATVRAPFRLDQYRPPLIRGDTVYAVALDDDDVQHVVRARIRR
jgi:streptogramin lyase